MTLAVALNWLLDQIGKHLDYDNQYQQQCFDFFNFYYQFITGDGPYNDGYAVEGAKDIWGVQNPRFTFISDSDDLIPQPGDIAIYGANWGAGEGHVEIVLETTSPGCWFVGENEHNNPYEGVVKVFRTWAQMRGLIGVMRFHWEPEDAPAPPPTEKFQVVETYANGKQIKLNKQPTYLWGMNYDFDYMVDHPIETHDAGEVWTVTSRVHHEDGYDYYRRDGQVDGFNVLDCDDYCPPAPAPEPQPPIINDPLPPTQPEEPSEPIQDPTPTPDPVETQPVDPTPTPAVPTESDSGTPSSEVPAKPVVVSTPNKWEQIFNAILAFLQKLFNKKG